MRLADSGHLLDTPYGMGMTFREKRDAALAELAARGVEPRQAAPPLYRWLWAVGVPVPPPLFQSFGGAFATHLVLLVPLAAVLASMSLFAVDRSLFQGAAVGGLAVCFTFARAAGLGVRKKAAELGLPRWRDFDPLAPDEAEGW